MPAPRSSAPRWTPFVTVAVLVATVFVVDITRSGIEGASRPPSPSHSTTLSRRSVGPDATPIEARPAGFPLTSQSHLGSPTLPLRVVVYGDESLQRLAPDVIQATPDWAVRVDAAPGRRLTDIVALTASLSAGHPDVVIVAVGQEDMVEPASDAALHMTDIARNIPSGTCAVWIDLSASTASHRAIHATLVDTVAPTAARKPSSQAEQAPIPVGIFHPGDVPLRDGEADLRTLVSTVEQACR